MSKNYSSEQERIDATWNKLEPLLVDNNAQFKPFSRQRMFAAASVILFISLLGYFSFKEYTGEITYATKYGETFKLILPDSSVVFMNGNTTVSYRKHWSKTGDREVKMEGEAYFSIKHTLNHQKFFVQMNDQTSVEVLGTEFNISKRGIETKVVLSSGKIQYNINVDNALQKSMIMAPGDLVEYRSDIRRVVKRRVNPEIWSSWKSATLQFDKTSLNDILNGIKSTYGLHVEVKDPSLLDMKVSGSAPAQNIDILIQGLSEIFDINLIRKKDTLIVSPNNLNN